MITMKKHNLSKLFKNKSFYVLLGVGTLAILVIAGVGIYQSSNKGNNDKLAKLEKPISEVVDEDNTRDKKAADNNNKPSSSVANNKDGDDKAEVKKSEFNKNNDLVTQPREPRTNDELLEYDAYENPNPSEDSSETIKQANDQTEEAQEVMKPTVFHFNHEEDKILWPVSGNVIRKYSMDSLTHYATLEQWKVSPAMLVSAEEGEDVSSATDGIVTSIVEDEETGLTMTTSIGDGYSLVYGQLEKLTVEEGESIEKGQIIGSVGKPTRFNSVEGPSLYLQLLKEDKTVDPMLCLE